MVIRGHILFGWLETFNVFSVFIATSLFVVKDDHLMILVGRTGCLVWPRKIPLIPLLGRGLA